MLAPAGAPGSRLKVRVLAGRSVSVAVFVTTNVLSSSIIWSAGTVSTGARFTSVTTTLKLRVSLAGGEQIGRASGMDTELRCPCDAVGDQEKRTLKVLMRQGR